MRKTYYFALICLFFLSVFTASAIGQGSKGTMGVSGVLVDDKGKAAEGAHAVQVTIYDAEGSEANVLYREIHNLVVGSDGAYTICIGTGYNPATMEFAEGIPAGVFAGDTWYLGMKIDLDQEMSPRTLLNAVPYAFNTSSLGNVEAAEFAKYAEAGEFSADISFNGTTTFVNQVTFNNNIYSNGNNTFTGDNNFTGDANFAGTVDFTGTISYNGTDINDIFVNVAGDTMTGALNLPADGLVVGTEQLVAKDGNIGIGTADPNYKLHVAGGNSRVDRGYLEVENSSGLWTRIDGTTFSSNTEILVTCELYASRGIRLGSTNNSVDGTMRWNGSNFQAYSGSSWKNIDEAGGSKDKIAVVDFTLFGYTSNAIQQAINSLGSQGGKVYIPSGNWMMTSTITFNYDNITVEGSGRGTILRWSSSAYNGIEINRRNGIVLKNMYIYGHGYNSGRYAVYMYGAKNCMIDNCWFYQWYYAIQAYSPSSSSSYANEYNTISNNFVYYCRYGVYAYGYSSSSTYRYFRYNTIVGNVFDMRTSSSYGIYIRYSQDNTITGNVFYRPYYGIYMNYGYNNVLSSNTIKYANSCGIHMDRCYYTSITGNTINDAGNYGIYSYYNYDCTFTGNHIYSPVSYGFYCYYNYRCNFMSNAMLESNSGSFCIYYGQENNIASNKIYYSNRDAIYVRYSQHNSIINNNFSNCGRHGIYLDSGCNYTTVTGNKIHGRNYNSGYYGVYTDGNYYLTINDNHIYYFFFGMYLSYCHYSNITGNAAHYTYNYGYDISYCNYSNISSNTSYYARYSYGFNTFCCRYCVMSSNNSSNSNGYGFRFYELYYSTIIGNNSGGRGMWYNGGAWYYYYNN